MSEEDWAGICDQFNEAERLRAAALERLTLALESANADALQAARNLALKQSPSSLLARMILQEQVAQAPEDWEALLFLAQVALFDTDRATARLLVKRAAAHAPETTLSLLLLQATLSSDPREEATLLRRILEERPDDPTARNRLRALE